MVLDLGVEGGGATVFRTPLGSGGWGLPGFQRCEWRVPLCLPLEWRAEIEEREFRLGEGRRQDS